MKKLFLIAISCLQLALTIEAFAAPPLRVLMPMHLSDGSMVMHSDVNIAPLAVEGYCASSAVIGDAAYLQHIGSPRILTILAEFQDVGFTVNDPFRAFEQYLNGDKQEDLGNQNQMNISSVRQYFETSSHQKFSPKFDIVGPLILPQNMAYYGGIENDGSDDKFSDFCHDVMEIAKDVVSDWEVYDNDKDGQIELVCVIFAGYGQNQGGPANTIWAKASYQNIKLDDKLRVARFNCCPELFNPYQKYANYINGTGVFIHEFSHCMGLPDLYATRRMGWTEIEELKPTADSPQQITDLLPLIEGGKAYKLKNADNDREYIVMENVQKRGLNEYGGAHGLLVYHVDYPKDSINMTDAPNNNPGHPAVAVVPAGGILINSNLRGKNKRYSNNEWKMTVEAAVFPGTENVTSLTDQMQLPNYCFWNDTIAKATGFQLNTISENVEMGTVSFIVASNDPSSIDDVRWLKADGSNSIYDLLGRKIQGCLKPGIYIVEGRKIYVK